MTDRQAIDLYSVIDIGSNTVRLVIYRTDNNCIQPILNKKYTAGLAGYVDKKNCLSAAGVQKLIDILQEFKTITQLLPDCVVYPFATASLRNVVNTKQVVEEVKAKTGFDIQVLSGYEEAMLDYRGAIRHMQQDAGLLVDIGGGSTELVFFREQTVLAAHSLPVGSLNLYSQFVSGLFPTKKEMEEMDSYVQKLLRQALPPARDYIAQPLCSVGGTARAALLLYQSTNKQPQEPEYDVCFLDKILRQAQENPRKVMRKILKIAPERVHTLIPGMLIFSNVAALYGSRTVITSAYGVREGYLSYKMDKEEDRL